MQVHIALTYLLLILIYFHLEYKILVKIPDSLLDSALALLGKVGDIVREKLINLSDLVKINPKHTNNKSSRKIKNTAKYLQSLLTFSYVFLF